MALRHLYNSNFKHKEKQRGCPLLGANKYTHIYIKYIYYQTNKYMCVYLIQELPKLKWGLIQNKTCYAPPQSA